MKQHSTGPPNRLHTEKSPYLLAHATNPVDWWPWGDAAFAEAKRRDVPVFLSVGYHTCHWCHVMERESFENAEVAALLNEYTVPVKVDREERPDVDSVYMTICQMLTGRGGWPLTCLLTPEREPFFAGTYFPPDAMLEMLPRLAELWRTRRGDITEQAAEITSSLREYEQRDTFANINPALLDAGAEQLATSFDRTFGGFAGAPKFPAPHNLLYLLHRHETTRQPGYLSIVVKTLCAMYRGGIFDHLGGGFHRYSTDERWLLPHFEKMLYDQAMILWACAEGYRASGDETLRRAGMAIIDYVQRDLRDPDGAYYCGEDADSEGEEGRFYVWSEAELNGLLGPNSADAELFKRVYTIRGEGNFADEATGERTGTNVLHRTRPLADMARDEGMDEETLRRKLRVLRQRLFHTREERMRPALDDKILTDWNGLMIGALAVASRTFGTPLHATSAARAAQFIHDRLTTSSGHLLHRYHDGHAGVEATLTDYSYLCWGLVELYQTTGDPHHLARATTHGHTMLALFHDQERGGFFTTAADVGRETADLPVRQRDAQDGALPSGNAMAAYVLTQLSRLTGNEELTAIARRCVEAFGELLDEQPAAHTMLLTALHRLHEPATQVVVAGATCSGDTAALLQAAFDAAPLNTTVLLRPSDSPEAIQELAPHVAPMHGTADDPGALAFVCHDRTCAAPVRRSEDLRTALHKLKG